MLIISNRTATSTNLSWAEARDDVSLTNELDYRVCLTVETTVTGYADADSKCLWYSRWSRALNDVTIHGLMPHVTHYVTVFVRDRLGNTSQYEVRSIALVAADSNSVYVDDQFTITNDQGSPGIDIGDTVTFAAGTNFELMNLIFGISAFDSLADAEDAITAVGGGTIFVAPGQHDIQTQMLITTETIIVGSEAKNTEIRVKYDTSGSGDARGAILVDAGASLNLAATTISGTGQAVYNAIRLHGTKLGIHGCIIRDVKHTPYLGQAIQTIAGNVVIEATRFENIERIGAFLTGTGIHAFRWNHWQGKGTGDHVGYMLVVDGSPDTQAYENYAVDIRGEISGGYRGAGFYVHQIYDAQSVITLYRNTVENSYVGAYIGFSNDLSMAYIHKNIFGPGVDSGVLSESSQFIEAKNNWWGDASGPKHSTNPTATGAVVADGVDFSSWAKEIFIP